MQTEPQSTEDDRVRLVVGFDFTDASVYALRLAERLVRPAGPRAELHVVHVTHPPYWPAVNEVPPFVPTVSPEVTPKQLLDACFSPGWDVEASLTPHICIGDVTGEIANLAREVHADLIVIGSHKRKGLASALHRSTYARIVRRSPCSVLTALPKEEPPEAIVEPPCDACLSVRRESAGAIQWCTRHSVRHIHGHLHHSSPDPSSASAWTFRS